MTIVQAEAEAKFFEDVNEAAKKAVWCALATSHEGEPRVRMVHPTWEGKVLWLATGTGSPKLNQMQANPTVDVQFQVAPPDFVHLLVRGQATPVTDAAEKKRVWDVLDYDLSQFWKDGPESPDYTPVRIEPSRVELSMMFGMANKRVWRG